MDEEQLILHRFLGLAMSLRDLRDMNIPISGESTINRMLQLLDQYEHIVERKQNERSRNRTS